MFTAAVTASATISASEQVSVEKLNLLGAPSVAITGTADAVDISDAAVTTAKLDDEAVTDAKVSASASIALSKLAAVTSTNVVAGDSSNAAAAHELLGDVELNRAVSLTVSGITPGALFVGDILQAGSIVSSVIVKLGAESGSPLKQTAHLLVTSGDTTGLLGVAHTVYTQPSTMVVRHSSATRVFTLGSTLAGSSASARVLTCSAGVLDTGSYNYTVTLDNVTGCFTGGESLTIDGVASALTVQAASGRAAVGATLVNAGVTEFSLNTTVLAVSTPADNPAAFVTAGRVRTESGDIAGKVLTSTGAYTEPTWQTPTISSPLVRGGAAPFVPENWVGGSATAYVGTVHASAWELHGWQYDGANYKVYLYNANFNTTTLSGNKGELAVDDVIVFFPKTSAPGVQPFDTEQAIATEETGVASSYAAYRVASVVAVASTVGSLVNVREVQLVRNADSTPVTWNTTTYTNSTGSATSKALCGRKAFAATGGIIFKCGNVNYSGAMTIDPPTTGGAATGGGAYVLLFTTPAALSNYAVNITAGGAYVVATTLGDVAGAQSFIGGYVIPTYRTTRRVHFNYQTNQAAQSGGAYRNEPRDMSVIIYEQ